MSQVRAPIKAVDPSVREILEYIESEEWTDTAIVKTAGLTKSYLYELRQRRWNPQIVHLNAILGVFGLRLGIVSATNKRGRPVRRKNPYAGKEPK
jgi:hypothetical protein